ncbi:hypothetical protein GW756_05740 [bacterium]|nr:hypothetical protein [bacterium]NCQ55922.1 hypothetical protein [Candidatus Parcubacteria bacterium]NCS67947.1 hypothetical protein [Candidatus Peregrinibacteria bacterium]NCS96841.1 hypothetical protein [bacterium]
MRLKVSPKVVIDRIDELVKSGQELLSEVNKEYFEILDERDNDGELDFGGLFSQSNDFTMPPLIFGLNNEDYLKRLAEYQAEIKEKERKEQKQSEFRSKQEAIVENWRKKYKQWQQSCFEVFEIIFSDYVPVNTFERASSQNRKRDLYEIYFFGKHTDLVALLEVKLKVLRDFYTEISKNVRSPLTYLSEKNQIVFYDFVCQLKPDSNEALLCKKMFEFPIGESIEEIDVYEFITGDNDGISDKSSHNLIKNACDGVNRKTKDSFGFSIMKNQAKSIKLSIPSKIIANL